jgi:hypothetical protein
MWVLTLFTAIFLTVLSITALLYRLQDIFGDVDTHIVEEFIASIIVALVMWVTVCCWGALWLI